MEIKFVYNEDLNKFVEADDVQRLASRLIAKYTMKLSPGGEIFVSTTVTCKKLYGWLERVGGTILNHFLTLNKFQGIIKEAMKRNEIFQFGWTIQKGLKGRYVSLFDGEETKDDTVRIILNNTPMYVVEEIATKLCQQFRQENVLIHDLKKNTFKYWSA